jgi:hypothetical protein
MNKLVIMSSNRSMDEDNIYTSIDWRLGSDGRIHRKRQIQYPNGEKYHGEIVNGLRDGFGKLKTMKFSYTGSFHHGLFNGNGTFLWHTFKEDGVEVVGRKYVGTFCNGKRDGKGLLFDGKGGMWDGMWKDDQFTGRGEVKKDDGEVQTGMFVNGKLHDTNGKIRFKNGDVYEGGVHFGTLHSEVAHISYSHGNSSYTGQFHYNLKQGIGTRRFIDGSTYRGNFHNNNIDNGHGTMHYAPDNPSQQQRKQYSGEWEDGVFHGDGELIFKDCCDVKSYKGRFYKGLYHGFGILVYRDGGYYEGNFNAKYLSLDARLASSPLTGTKHGQGTRVWVSGNKFEGTWENDLMVEGKYFNKKYHSTYVGTFAQNKKSGSAREIWRSPDGKSYRDPCLGWKHKENDTCKYIGEYESGYFHGKGTFSSFDGRSYCGGWKMGKQHGYGVATLLAKYQTGDAKRMFIGRYGSLYKPIRYEGTWENGVRHGEGKLIYLDGSFKEGKFVNGHLLET